MLPISVLLPTRNSMALLPGHLETMRSWLGLVEEVVVVDSDSTDGTWECLGQALSGSNVRFFRHPPGLYQSWNHGIAQVRSTYTYISTVGDEMSRDGLLHLVEVAEQLACDVVISPPKFVDESGRKRKSRGWPVHTIIRHGDVCQPVSLQGVPLFLLVFALIPHAIIGSSASNLYRTSTMQHHPFPSDFGHHGDGAWAVGNCLNIRLGITAQEVSFFRRHHRSYAMPGRDPNLELRMVDLALARLRSEVAANPSLGDAAADVKLEEILPAITEAKSWRSRLRGYRAGRWPWVLSPVALWAKYRETMTQRQCDELIARVSRSLKTRPADALRASDGLRTA
jgi:glycosyltransferase involved in cell wall biosynthesis